MNWKYIACPSLSAMLYFNGPCFSQSKYGDNMGNHIAKKDINVNNNTVINVNSVAINKPMVSNSSIALSIESTSQTILLSRVTGLLTSSSPIPAASAIDGMMVYDNTTSKFYARQAGKWISFLTTLTNNYLWIGNNANEAVAVAISGDVTINTTGVVTIGNNVINSNKIADGSIATQNIALNTLTLAKIKPATQAGQQVTSGVASAEWATPIADNYLSIGDYTMLNSSSLSGWLLCDGSAKSRSTYAALFAVIGTKFGVGDGSTTFNVPDLRGRIGGGAGVGASLSPRSFGAMTGTETNTISQTTMPQHDHSGIGTANTAGEHVHQLYTRLVNNDGGGSWALSTGGDAMGTVPSAGEHSHPTVTLSSIGSGTAFNNMKPTLFTGNYFIYAGL